MPYVESAQRTKEAVAAARIVLMREGVGRTTMRAVAAEAGIPLGTLQYVFPSKQGLLKAVIEDVVDEIAEVLRGAADTKAGLNDAIRRGTGISGRSWLTNTATCSWSSTSWSPMRFAHPAWRICLPGNTSDTPGSSRTGAGRRRVGPASAVRCPSSAWPGCWWPVSTG